MLFPRNMEYSRCQSCGCLELHTTDNGDVCTIDFDLSFVTLKTVLSFWPCRSIYGLMLHLEIRMFLSSIHAVIDSYFFLLLSTEPACIVSYSYTIVHLRVPSQTRPVTPQPTCTISTAYLHVPGDFMPSNLYITLIVDLPRISRLKCGERTAK